MCSPRNRGGGERGRSPRPGRRRSLAPPFSRTQPWPSGRSAAPGRRRRRRRERARARRRPAAGIGAGDCAAEAHLRRRAGRGSRRARSRDWRERLRARSGSSARLGYAPPRPAPLQGRPCCALKVLKSRPRGPRFGRPAPNPRSNNSLPFRKALCVPAGSLPGVGLASGVCSN